MLHIYNAVPWCTKGNAVLFSGALCCGGLCCAMLCCSAGRGRLHWATQNSAVGKLTAGSLTSSPAAAKERLGRGLKVINWNSFWCQFERAAVNYHRGKNRARERGGGGERKERDEKERVGHFDLWRCEGAKRYLRSLSRRVCVPLSPVSTDASTICIRPPS